MEREPNTEYVLSLSYGKDSCACIGAIEKFGLPLDRIIHAEVWATDTIPADLPPMVEFKAKADEIIYKRTGIKVEHIYATRKLAGGDTTNSLTNTYSTQQQTPSDTEYTDTDSLAKSSRGAIANSKQVC